jgi:hypothetical protein
MGMGERGLRAGLAKIRPVQTMRRLFRQATWLALVAILGLALVPTLSHALAASGAGEPWSEICSAASGQVPSVDAGERHADAGVHLGHCPLCGQVGHAPALPPADPAGIVLPD